MPDWSVPIDSLVNDIYEGDIGAAVRDFGFQGLTGCTEFTPVDTGRLRGAWLVSRGSPRNENSKEEFGGNEGAATQYALANGALTISQVRAGDVIYIENNVEYGIFVNDGTDKIPPHRMIERTIERLAGE
jgi:hypothetical protein